MTLAEVKRGDATSLTKKLHDFSEKYVKISNENMTRTRKLVKDYIEGEIIEYCRRKSKLPILNLEYTGSFYERLKTEAADEVDIMVVLGTPGSEIEVIESEVPGYVRLRANSSMFHKYLSPDSHIDPRILRDRWTYSLVCQAVNKFNSKSQFSEVHLNVRHHGPAVQVDIFRKGSDEKFVSVDLVPCFQLADMWYVPKPFKGKRFVLSHGLLWRQSFSLQEKQVLEFMDREDHGCRHELLRIVKTMFKRPVMHSLPLESYYLKTAFMHYIRGEGQNWVNRDALGKHFLGFLRELENLMESKNLPHYWLPDINLLDDFTKEFVEQMARRLRSIRDIEVKLNKILA